MARSAIVGNLRAEISFDYSSVDDDVAALEPLLGQLVRRVAAAIVKPLVKGDDAAMTVTVEGLEDAKAALRELPKVAAKSTLRRVLNQAAETIVAAAKSYVSVDTGTLRDSIIASTQARGTKANAQRQQAAIARYYGKPVTGQSRRDGITIYIGPSSVRASAKKRKGETVARSATAYAQFIEFGTAEIAAHPYMRPAFDAKGEEALGIVASNLSAEIQKTVDRAARKAARLLAKG